MTTKNQLVATVKYWSGEMIVPGSTRFDFFVCGAQCFLIAL